MKKTYYSMVKDPFNLVQFVQIMVQIKYDRFNSVQNDVVVCILLDQRNKILTKKWTNGGF